MIATAPGYRNLQKRFLTLLAFLVLASSQSFALSDYPTVFPLPILVLDQEALFSDSKLGQAILFVGAERRTVLLQESREISDAFELEELQLTQKRSEISIEDFRALSDDFDARVQATRESQLTKDVELQQYIDGQSHRFLVLAAPYLSNLMLKYQASAIVDQRSVLLFDRKMDITREAIELLDQAFEQNPDLAREEE